MVPAVLVAIVGIIVGSAGPAMASTSPSAGSGADVSWPQCLKTDTSKPGPLPSAKTFGIVGVNQGRGNTTNPCLAGELAWAETAKGTGTQPATSLYVMLQDPGLQADWWPHSDKTRDQVRDVKVPPAYGTCNGAESAACAYVYGYDMAYEDATTRGVSSPASYRWWIDVETTNTWALSKSTNQADVEGMAAYFTSIGAGVGLYSTAAQWQKIAGTTASTSPLAGLPSWIANTGPEADADTNCYSPGLTPRSRVTLAQFQTEGFDYDLACRPLSPAPVPTVTGTKAVDQTLSAHVGTWATGSALRFQWKRDGAAIAGATATTYRTTQSDAGHAVTFSVSASASGYTPIVRTSAAMSIPVPVSALAIGHTLASGQTLLAPNGRYRLAQQADGNLVLYKDTGKALWSDHRFGKSHRTTMQSDGNLVSYTSTHHAVWSTGTNRSRAVRATVQNDGNFVLYTAAGKAVWASHTNGK